MHAKDQVENVASTLLSTKGLQLVSCRTLQTLWAGYGHVCEIQAVPAARPEERPLSLILKCVSPPLHAGKRHDEGHLRKVISYQVEQYFYSRLAPTIPKDVAVASCLASVDSHHGPQNITAMILSDLRQNFPVAGEKRAQLNKTQVFAAVNWLAGFHGFWWTKVQDLPRDKLRRPPLEENGRTSNGTLDLASSGGGVWLNGGYTYLATRMGEYANLKEDNTSEWVEVLCAPQTSDGESIAQRVAKFLSPSITGTSCITEYETLLHGDVKSENLFTTLNGDAVAFYDFQYVGLGLGVCDLAKLFTCSVPEEMLFENVSNGFMHPAEESLLRCYLKKLEETSGKKYDWPVFVRHWEVALVDWLRFQASWGFWGNTDWLESRVRAITEDVGWKAWLAEQLNRP